jgi:hypothetical protein
MFHKVTYATVETSTPQVSPDNFRCVSPKSAHHAIVYRNYKQQLHHIHRVMRQPRDVRTGRTYVY